MPKKVTEIKEVPSALTTYEDVSCKFCGQFMKVEAAKGMSQEEVCELATERCGCSESTSYISRKRRTQDAHEAIENTFDDRDEEVVKIFHAAVPAFVDGLMTTLNINFGNGIKGKMSVNSKDYIIITRTDTYERSEQV